MSYIFTLKSCNHELSIDFINPIHLDPEADYAIALISFHSYNSIPNIEEGENKIHCVDKFNLKDFEIKLPTGSYEILDIEKYIRRQIIPKNIRKEEDREKYFSLKPNLNTLKCEIFSSIFEINFKSEDSIGRLLGFSKKRVLEVEQLHESDLPVDIIKVRTIQINCNITAGAFYNDRPSHTIHEFAVSVDPGFAIDEIPKNHVYLPIINKSTISNITLTVLDQNFKPVNFRGETVIIRLELKKIQ